MTILTADCPRCGAKRMTFDVKSSTPIGVHHGWQLVLEFFSICRACRKSTVFVASQENYTEQDQIRQHGPLGFKDSLDNHFRVHRFVSIADRDQVSAPEHTDQKVAAAFSEAAMCMKIGAWNAAATMLRLSLDLATRPMLPPDFTPGLNRRTRRDLAPRLEWLISNGRLPAEMSDLLDCIREDGNDGAHVGSLKKEDAEDLMDFAIALYERVYTEPTRLRLAKERREKRRDAHTE
ncbi:DUF4145 domain-containing protein [Bradyrhizobium yuanmingense]|uniref:DUF4145 domain-containing protein n=1 Tax=Bradyrhizobium yuanmingense TaxID=108015 RepID=UPI000FE350B6|nr:DUF4145 domain-containing protein [Bradyrhizobium yuanmingense]TGN90899.1 DUF4145 domain-containing protein [Bradyrhizobium yuanmingense]